jgi:hypothetical protein
VQEDNTSGGARGRESQRGKGESDRREKREVGDDKVEERI